MSIGPCPKVPARWPSVHSGLPRPAGEGSMQLKPDEGGDPAKCLSAGSSKHMPLPRPVGVHARVHVHTHFTHKFYSVIQPVKADGSWGKRGGEGRPRPTQDHSPPSEV